MNRKSLLAIAAGLMLTAGSAHAQQKCEGSDIANGPFAYSAASTPVGIFTGITPPSTDSSFLVTAPSPSPDRLGVDNVFPGQGQNPCLGRADAHVHVHEIVKIEAADNSLLPAPVEILPSDPLFQTLASKFLFSLKVAGVCDAPQALPSVQFVTGEQKEVCVTILNPNLTNPAEFGKYMVWMKAHAPAAGIGTGPGTVFTLDLNFVAPDNVPPTLTINKPMGNQILGVVPVEISATDPAPGSGVASMSATVSSTGGAVSNQALALVAAGLPQGSGAAGTPVVATSSFTPFGGTGTAGTSLAQAFTATNRSGIGTYLLNAQATDGAGNTGFGNAIFQVKYNVGFTMSAVPSNGCGGSATRPNFNPCNAMFEFKANRSSVTSDGKFMFDLTVVLKVVRTSDGVVVATRTCNAACGGNLNLNVQIDAVNELYKSHIHHNSLDANPSTPAIDVPTTLNEYRVDVYFMDVDGNLMLQGSSTPLMF